jgi:hypothetical protein
MKSNPLRFFVILSKLTVFSLTGIVSYSRSGLLAHPEWISGKRLLATPIMGSEEEFLRRDFLNENCLNLQDWHGYN